MIPVSQPSGTCHFVPWSYEDRIRQYHRPVSGYSNYAKRGAFTCNLGPILRVESDTSSLSLIHYQWSVNLRHHAKRAQLALHD